jgi:hypothetical protein
MMTTQKNFMMKVTRDRVPIEETFTPVAMAIEIIT